MNIYQLIEELNIYKDRVTNEQLYQLVPCYNIDQWIHANNLFVSGLDNHHQVPGRVVETLIGISSWHRDQIPVTQKQLYYLVHHLIEYWDQLGIEARSELML